MVLKLILYMEAVKKYLLLIFPVAMNKQADVGMPVICFKLSF